MTRAHIVFILLISAAGINGTSFENSWSEMQKEYTSLCHELDKARFTNTETYLYHPYWKTIKDNIAELIVGPPNNSWWEHPAITATMFRNNEIGYMQNYELVFLLHCLPQKILDKISSIKETSLINAPRISQEFPYTANTLGHLYYLSQMAYIAEQQRITVNTIVEFGSGFGNLAKLCKEYWPHATILLIDLPEFLALQYLFLTQHFPDTPIIMHKTKPVEFQDHAFHLIPIHFFTTMDVTADLFISTFALSETPEFVQITACQKNFFNAQVCYITGQLQGWNSQFDDTKVIIEALQKNYKLTFCNPFHMPLESTVHSYEIIAVDPQI